jgi:hypothetical protein
LPCVRFSTTHSGIDGLTMPAIGPTAPWWWQGSSAKPPEATSRPAASTESAQPSSTTAPSTAPCIGPHICGHAIGGPACRMRRWPPAIAGSASRAGTTSTSTGCAAAKRPNASALAFSTRASAKIAASAQPASRSPCAGGCQSSATQSPPAATMSAPNPARPTLITDSESLNSVAMAASAC